MRLQTSVGSPTAAPKHILLTRLGAIGDCILTIPVAVQAKKLWPGSKLTWIVDCAAEQLLKDHPCVDEVVRIEKRWLKRPSNWSALRGELQSRRFDLVLDPQGLTKSASLGWLSGAKTRIGFDYSHARELAPMLATRRVRRHHRHMVDTYLQVLEPWIKLPTGSGEFCMPDYAEAAEQASKILGDLDLVSLGPERLSDVKSGNGKSNWIALNPGAGWTTRQWPVERFGKLALEVFRRHGRRSLVFWAGQEELLMAKVIAEESQGAAVVAPATNLCEMFELLRQTRLLVTADTGPLHMASALGVPCVSLHGPTWANESGPYRNQHISIQSSKSRLTNKMDRRGPNLAMQAIEVDEVCNACDRILSEEDNSSRMVA